VRREDDACRSARLVVCSSFQWRRMQISPEARARATVMPREARCEARGARMRDATRRYVSLSPRCRKMRREARDTYTRFCHAVYVEARGERFMRYASSRAFISQERSSMRFMLYMRR